MKFTCPRCGMTSYNTNDVRNSYCGNCHLFFDDGFQEPLTPRTREPDAVLQANWNRQQAEKKT
jgi:hypothetical protein